jgi:hypothetical protein
MVRLEWRVPTGTVAPERASEFAGSQEPASRSEAIPSTLTVVNSGSWA